MISRLAEWIALQIDTYKVAKEEGMSYWQLRRIRKFARALVEMLKAGERSPYFDDGGDVNDAEEN